MLGLPLLDDDIGNLSVVRPTVLYSLAPDLRVVLEDFIRLDDSGRILFTDDDCLIRLWVVINRGCYPGHRVVFKESFAQDKRAEVISPGPIPITTLRSPRPYR